MKQTFGTGLKLIAAAAAALTIGQGALPAQAQSNYSGTNDSGSTYTRTTSNQVVLDPGTVIPVTLDTELSSNFSRDGDRFTATVDTSRQAYNNLMSGATVEGVVRRAVPQEGKDPGTLELAFTRLRLSDGSSYVISGRPTSLDSKDLKVRTDGVLEAKKGSTDQSLTYAGIGAGAGLLIGILNGGKINLQDLLIGGALGYGAGQVLKNNNQQVHDVDLKAGTPVGVLLGNRVLYHRRAITDSTTTNSTATQATPTQTKPSVRRYYSYHGHPYYLDLTTGQRVRLD
jgi:hypothetical protein